VNTILSLATAIEADWLRELFPGDIESDLHVQFDSTKARSSRRVVEISRTRAVSQAR
jgi:hypothetical protein